jgi:hypothetical protein
MYSRKVGFMNYAQKYLFLINKNQFSTKEEDILLTIFLNSLLRVTQRCRLQNEEISADCK